MDKREITDTIVIHCTQTPSDMDFGVDKVTQWHKNRGQQEKLFVFNRHYFRIFGWVEWQRLCL